eukprot:CAMPEP_0172557570 /NCGR_PEP_ID=MMETSP1067-20121228/74050_1 /TAXON_ID=265564 ORGANISM="Thalassiosira punctigera, Strain Tpunct2005C2" /NCGR_SAMPLE_ID=MMETSP1067 /ASSEMBLY_ACC=CAM_ASM_000444 /LENGTH=165 /DNA_ID=CAMNT_0013346691 /DNA_START=18 /DNA_END=515 /DNA_ORIENTATION=-
MMIFIAAATFVTAKLECIGCEFWKGRQVTTTTGNNSKCKSELKIELDGRDGKCDPYSFPSPPAAWCDATKEPCKVLLKVFYKSNCRGKFTSATGGTTDMETKEFGSVTDWTEIYKLEDPLRCSCETIRKRFWLKNAYPYDVVVQADVAYQCSECDSIIDKGPELI